MTAARFGQHGWLSLSKTPQKSRGRAQFPSRSRGKFLDSFDSLLAESRGKYGNCVRLWFILDPEERLRRGFVLLPQHGLTRKAYGFGVQARKKKKKREGTTYLGLSAVKLLAVDGIGSKAPGLRVPKGFARSSAFSMRRANGEKPNGILRTGPRNDSFGTRRAANWSKCHGPLKGGIFFGPVFESPPAPSPCTDHAGIFGYQFFFFGGGFRIFTKPSTQGNPLVFDAKPVFLGFSRCSETHPPKAGLWDQEVSPHFCDTRESPFI